VCAVIFFAFFLNRTGFSAMRSRTGSHASILEWRNCAVQHEQNLNQT
jgi:hypothetical protein